MISRSHCCERLGAPATPVASLSATRSRRSRTHRRDRCAGPSRLFDTLLPGDNDRTAAKSDYGSPRWFYLPDKAKRVQGRKDRRRQRRAAESYGGCRTWDRSGRNGRKSKRDLEEQQLGPKGSKQTYRRKQRNVAPTWKESEKLLNGSHRSEP